MIKILLFALVFWCNSLFSQWELLGAKGFTPFAFGAGSLQLVLDRHELPSIVYEDGRGPTVYRHEEYGWDTIGNRSFWGHTIGTPSLAFDQSNHPYAAFYALGSPTPSPPFVKMYNGTDWIQIGNHLIPSSASYTSIAIHPFTNEPYVAFRDQQKDFRATVMRYDGSNWVFVGNRAFSDAGDGYAGATHLELMFDPSGTPFLLYNDISNDYKASVMYFNGSNWEYLGGSAGCTPGEAGTTSGVIGQDGTFYLAFGDATLGKKMRVMKFNGSSWEFIGSPFGAGACGYSDLALDAEDNLFVCYRDAGMGGKACVRTFDGSNWIAVGGAPTVSDGDVMYMGLQIDKKGTAYLAYQDGTASYKATVKRYLNAGMPVGIQEAGRNTKFTIHPNPATNFVSVSLECDRPLNATIFLRTATGQQLLKKQVRFSCEETTADIDISALSPGIYSMEVMAGDLVKSAKLVVVH